MRGLTKQCAGLSDQIERWGKSFEGRSGHCSLTEGKGERGGKPNRFFIAGGNYRVFEITNMTNRKTRNVRNVLE